jgi:hypothetical protein
MKLNELFLTERIINAKDTNSKEYYAKQVWNILQKKL